MQFYTIMIDFGRDTSKSVHGFGADVRPEMTRREVIEEVREILASDRKSLAFVKFTDGNYTEDQTAEITAAARASQADCGADDTAIDAINSRILAQRDHARDLRKHSEVV